MLRELAAGVRRGDIDPVELVETSFRRIERLDPHINAVVAVRERALDEARACVREGPLAGIPVLIKDLANCAGMVTRLGSPLTADSPPAASDDTTVARLRAAGAIPVGKTNTPAYGWTAVTSNRVHGTTRNPWNPERSPGGSSGGSAAALAAGLAPLATTSDGGGSVRIPASLCGLVGYKPTIGAVGRDGAPRWIDFSGWGATGRTVDDVVVEASVYLGPTVGDLRSLPVGAIEFGSLDRSDDAVRVLVCPTLRTAIAPVIAEGLSRTVAELEASGLEVIEIDNPVPAAMTTWVVIATAELAQSLLHLRDRWDELDEGLVTMLEFGARITAEDYIAARRRTYEICAALDRLLDGRTLLITPTLNVESWPAEGPIPEAIDGVGELGIAVNTPEFNLSGHPVVSVPMGFDTAGVPFGVQIVGPRWRDALVLQLARRLEELRPWPISPPGFEPFAPS
jgi:Asp-tRNA(Asn)/Glu-tRNA(Gln) amidotransferase A subunit family amidase